MTISIDVGQLTEAGRCGMSYAQERIGQKLHIVQRYPQGAVSDPLCGRHIKRWRMTINMPMGWTCKNCLRILRKRRAMEA